MRTPLPLISLTVAVTVAAGLLSAASSSPDRGPGAPYSVLQMNLCLSGVAGCYSRTAYPSVVDEAARQIGSRAPDAVTLNEACSGDATRLARQAGYHLSFAPVLVDDTPLPCVDPGGRGVFGLALLTRDDVTATAGRAFAGQAGPEERRWLCATTSRAVTVCTAHLDTRDSDSARRANDDQCGELRRILATYDAAGPTLFGGDLNRQDPCAPPGMWASEDDSAAQLAGIQHIYGSRSVGELSGRVAAATYTDHDFFVA